MRIIAIAGLTLFLSGPAWAQTPAAAPPTPDTDLTKLGFVSAGDIAAGLKKLPQDRADISMRIFQIPPYNVNAAHRAPVAQRRLAEFTSSLRSGGVRRVAGQAVAYRRRRRWARLLASSW